MTNIEVNDYWKGKVFHMGAWIEEMLGILLRVQDHFKIGYRIFVHLAYFLLYTVFLSFQKPNNKRNCNDVSLGNPPDAKIPRVDDTTTPTTPTATTSSSQQVSTPQTSTNRNEEEEEGEND